MANGTPAGFNLDPKMLQWLFGQMMAAGAGQGGPTGGAAAGAAGQSAGGEFYADPNYPQAAGYDYTQPPNVQRPFVPQGTFWANPNMAGGIAPSSLNLQQADQPWTPPANLPSPPPDPNVFVGSQANPEPPAGFYQNSQQYPVPIGPDYIPQPPGMTDVSAPPETPAVADTSQYPSPIGPPYGPQFTGPEAANPFYQPFSPPDPFGFSAANPTNLAPDPSLVQSDFYVPPSQAPTDVAGTQPTGPQYSFSPGEIGPVGGQPAVQQPTGPQYSFSPGEIGPVAPPLAIPLDQTAQADLTNLPDPNAPENQPDIPSGDQTAPPDAPGAGTADTQAAGQQQLAQDTWQVMHGPIGGDMPLYPTTQDVFPQPNQWTQHTGWENLPNVIGDVGQFFRDAAGNIVDATGRVLGDVGQFFGNMGYTPLSTDFFNLNPLTAGIQASIPGESIPQGVFSGLGNPINPPGQTAGPGNLGGSGGYLPTPFANAIGRGIWTGKGPMTAQNFANLQGWLNYQGNPYGGHGGYGLGRMSYSDYLDTWNRVNMAPGASAAANEIPPSQQVGTSGHGASSRQ